MRTQSHVARPHSWRVWDMAVEQLVTQEFN